MTPPTDADVAAIAAGLTKAQRREIVRGAIGDAPLPLIRRLICMGLMHVVPHSPNGQFGPCVNTPLGIRVRAHLLRESA